jgi:hypothetical protein
MRGKRKLLAGIALIGLAALILLALPSDDEEGEQQATPTTGPCAVADALSAAGEAKPAKKAYVGVLQADPGSECAATGLKELNTPSPDSKSWWTRAADWVTGAIPTALVLLGAAAILFYLLLMVCRIPSVKDAIGRFPKLGGLVRWMLRPRLAFAKFDDEAVEGKPGGPSPLA